MGDQYRTFVGDSVRRRRKPALSMGLPRPETASQRGCRKPVPGAKCVNPSRLDQQINGSVLNRARVLVNIVIMTESGGRIDWFIHDGEREIGPLTELELRKRLRRGRRSHLRVRQNDGAWYPANDVVRKFRELAENGIYIKLGTVAGPYTAEKAFQILSRLSLNGVKAKIGLHGFWVPAERLFAQLQKAIDKANPQSHVLAADASEHARDEPLVAADANDAEGIVLLHSPDDDDGNEVHAVVSGLPVSDQDRFMAEAMPIVEPMTEPDPIPIVEPITELDSIATVEPIACDPIPVVQPIAEESIVIVDRIGSVPVVYPKPAKDPLMHACACGRAVRVMPQHAGMTMQCPACKRTFVAGQ